jgi:hypothetical protein
MKCKSIPLGDKRRLEFRWEALNAFNHSQFFQVPLISVNGAPVGRFLNRDFTDSGIRSMWGQIKLIFSKGGEAFRQRYTILFSWVESDPEISKCV